MDIHLGGDATHGQTQTGGSAGSPAKVSGIRAVVEVRVAGSIAAIVTSELRKVIELAKNAAQGCVIVKAIEVSCVECIAELWSESCAARGSQVHHASQRVGAVKHAIGAAKDFNLVNPCGKDSTKINCAANLIERNAIEKDFVELALASADKQRFVDPALAVFQHLHAGDLAQRLQHLRRVLKLVRGHNRDGCAGLRLRQAGAGGRDHDLLRHAADLERDVNRRIAGAPYVDGIALLLRERRRLRLYPVTSGRERRKTVLPF